MTKKQRIEGLQGMLDHFRKRIRDEYTASQTRVRELQQKYHDYNTQLVKLTRVSIRLGQQLNIQMTWLRDDAVPASLNRTGKVVHIFKKGQVPGEKLTKKYYGKDAAKHIAVTPVPHFNRIVIETSKGKHFIFADGSKHTPTVNLYNAKTKVWERIRGRLL